MLKFKRRLNNVKINKPTCLIILDGWGINSEKTGNAIKLAKTPFIDNLFEKYPNTQLKCSGTAVGLPDGVMGNSEVGHLNIGAGRIVYQDMLRINNAIKDKSFFENQTFNDLFAKIKQKNSSLHLMGLVSDGSVHSHINHIFALIKMAKEKNVDTLIHAIMDGRDTPPDSGKKYIQQLQNFINETGHGSIATICGRFYAMDRDKRWERIERAYDLYTSGMGTKETDPVNAVINSYEREEFDEFIKPIIMVDENGNPIKTIEDNDGVIFFNFRADRAREITKALTDPDFNEFQRKKILDLSAYVSMTMYEKSFDLPVAFPPVRHKNILGEVLSKASINQLRIAETEKYAHVTYFFNGGEEKPYPLEERKLIPSPREIETYDQKPEMSAYEVTKKLVDLIQAKKFDFIVLNYANMDMVGHTGFIDAAVKACETIDKCIKKIIDQVRSFGGSVIVTADHGNAEKMQQKDGKPHTAHTTNPVPFILVDDSSKNYSLRSDGILGDIAPTILDLMGLEKPSEMTGRSLLS